MSNAGSEFPPIDWANVPKISNWRGVFPPKLQKAKCCPSAFHQGQINVCRQEGLCVQAEHHVATEKNRAAKIGKQNASLERRYAELKAYARKKQVTFNYNAERKAVIAAAVAKFAADNPVPDEHDQDFCDAFFEDDDEIDAVAASAAIVIPPGNAASAAFSSSSATASGAAASSVSASASSASASDADEGLGSSQGQEEEEGDGDSGGLRRSHKRARRN